MKTIEDLKQFYNTTLTNDLKILEEKRKKTIKIFIFIWIILLPSTLILLFIIRPTLAEILPIVLGLLVLDLLIWWPIYVKTQKKYTKRYKSILIPQIAKFIDQNLSYSKNDYVSKADYVESDFSREIKYYKDKPFYRFKPSLRYEGKHLVAGKAGSVQIEYSEVKERTGNTPAGCASFKGPFFKIKFDKNFACKTVVIPRGADTFLGPAGKTLFFPWYKRSEHRINLGHPEFEKLFVVYSDDLVKPKYILTPQITKKITDHNRKIYKLFFFSFINSKLFVAIENDGDFLTPKLFKTFLDIEPIQEYFQDIMFIISIAEELNSNTNAWKQDQ